MNQMERVPVPTMQDVTELLLLGGVRVDGRSLNETPELGGETITIEPRTEDLGTACYNNSVWCLVTVDGQMWAFFRTEDQAVHDRREAIFGKLSSGRWNWVPYSNGGQLQLIRLVIGEAKAEQSILSELDAYLRKNDWRYAKNSHR
jgi:hypothetical protein